jgi:hypothetical protein
MMSKSSPDTMPEMLTMKQCGQRLGVPKSTVYKLLDREEGVHRYMVPGSKRPIIRVEASVIDRILRRSDQPSQFGPAATRALR